jgi:hypothetical protein
VVVAVVVHPDGVDEVQAHSHWWMALDAAASSASLARNQKMEVSA